MKTLQRIFRRRYRISKKTGHDWVAYVPQWRCWWSPIWLSWTANPTGHGEVVIFFRELSAAQSFLRKEIQRTGPVATEIIAQ